MFDQEKVSHQLVQVIDEIQSSHVSEIMQTEVWQTTGTHRHVIALSSRVLGALKYGTCPWFVKLKVDVITK